MTETRYTSLIRKAGLFITILMVISSPVLALKITEFESNPSGKDAGGEWIELFSDSEKEFPSLEVLNNDGDILSFNLSFNGYYTLVFSKQFLDNSDEKIILKLDGIVLDETPVFKDSDDTDFTWQSCSSGWEFKKETKGIDNGCFASQEEIKEEPPTKEEKNSSGIQAISNEAIKFSGSNTEEQDLKNSAINQEKIILNSPSQETFITKEERKRDLIFISFTIFTIIIIVLLALRKL